MKCLKIRSEYLKRCFHLFKAPIAFAMALILCGCVVAPVKVEECAEPQRAWNNPALDEPSEKTESEASPESSEYAEDGPHQPPCSGEGASESLADTDIADEGTVYFVRSGTVWHTTPSCSALSRSRDIQSGSVSKAAENGITRACIRCG